jgi:GNAT superfamily N-acetyltransferase
MRISIHRFSAEHEQGFWRIHDESHGCGWCACAAWWVPTWEGWSERTAEQNRSLRRSLIDSGEYDGYLIYLDDRPAGWCQAGRRDRLTKLVDQFELVPDADTWAITCFLILPEWRGRGLAGKLLSGVLDDLAQRGALRVEAYPRRGSGLDAQDLWNGPESTYLQAGFSVVRDDPRRPVLALELARGSSSGCV